MTESAIIAALLLVLAAGAVIADYVLPRSRALLALYRRLPMSWMSEEVTDRV